MKLACQEGLVPGANLGEKLANLERAGYEGIEFWGGNLWDRVKEINDACASSRIKPSSVCAGYGGCPLGAEPAERQRASDDIARLLDATGKIGAVGLIVVPIFGPPRVPDLSPWKTAAELEDELLVTLMDTWADRAIDAGTLVLLEPLNGYETHLVKTLSHAVRLVERVNKPKGLKIMADFFHMELEELDVAAAIREAGDWIAHVHLADHPRQLPGYGNSDFRKGFAALKGIGYSNYMALECGIPDPDPMAALTKTAKFLKAQM